MLKLASELSDADGLAATPSPGSAGENAPEQRASPRVATTTITPRQPPSPTRILMRLRRLVILLLACPFASAARAQQSPTPSRPKSPSAVAQTFRAFGRPFGAWILAALDSIPASRYGFRPTPGQQSVGFIAQHLENANYQLCATFGDAKYAMTAKDSLTDTIKAQWPKDTLIARVRASLVYCGAAIQKLSDAQLADELTVATPGGSETVLRVRYLILLVTDFAEHYSQLSNYMRILGLVPPSALPTSPPPK
jgi:hypothetical protein